jgi:DNA-directed RNA polymerase subunit F
MIGKEIVSATPVSLTTVKALLKERSTDKELTYEQKMSFEYAKKFAKLTPSKVTKLLEGLNALETIDEDLAVKIADMLPDDAERLKLIAQKTKASSEDLEKALALVKKYA